MAEIAVEIAADEEALVEDEVVIGEAVVDFQEVVVEVSFTSCESSDSWFS